MDLAAGYSWFSSPAPAQSLGMSCCLSFPSHRHQALCRELLHTPDTTCPVWYRLTPALLPPQHGQGWQQPTFAGAAGDTSALPAWQEKSLPWAGQEGARGVHGCQLGKREDLDPQAAQPAASPATPSANLATLSSPRAGPAPVPTTSSSPRQQLGSVPLTAPKSTQQHPAQRQGTPIALSGHHLLLAAEEGGCFCRPSAVQAPSHPACSATLPRTHQGSLGGPSTPSHLAQGEWGRDLGRVQGRQMQPQRGSCKLLEFGNCCSLWEFASGGEQPQGSVRAAGSSVLPLQWGNQCGSMGANPSPGQSAGSHPKSAQRGHTGLTERPDEGLSRG